MLRIGTGTKSHHKIGSIGAACILVGATAEITGDDVDSAIPPQPREFEQIVRGAKNRAKGSRVLHPDYDIWIGPESGTLVHHDDDGEDATIDLAVIAILYGESKGKWIFSTSPGVTFPDEFVTEWIAGGRKGTIGDFIAAKLGGTGTDPHDSLTAGRLRRAQTFVDGFKSALLQLPPELLRR